MPKLSGIFELFLDLDKLNLSHLAKSKGQAKAVENFIGNRILYPQTIAMDQFDLTTDFAVLMGGLKNQPEVVYNNWSKKITIYADLESRFPPLAKLVNLIIDAVKPKGVTQIFLHNQEGLHQIGTLIIPRQFQNDDLQNCYLNNQQLLLNQGEMVLLPVNERNQIIKLGKHEQYKVNGGKMGIFIDLRI